MTLKDLASILPGYAILHVHADNNGLRVSAGEVVNSKDLLEATVIKAIPLESCSLEVIIDLKGTPGN